MDELKSLLIQKMKDNEKSRKLILDIYKGLLQQGFVDCGMSQAAPAELKSNLKALSISLDNKYPTGELADAVWDVCMK